MQQQDSADETGVISDDKGGRALTRARDRKANAALQLKMAGATWEEIASTIGYPTARAALVATERALEKELRTEESQSQMRGLAGKRLERLLRSVWTKAINPDHPEHLAAVTKAREILASHSKLYGLDAPTEMVVHSPAQQELEKWVAEAVGQTVPQLEEANIFEAEWYEGEEEETDAVPAERVQGEDPVRDLG